MNSLPENMPILIFDGTCVMCNGFSAFVLKHDQSQSIHFISLQDERVGNIVKRFSQTTNPVDSVIFLNDGKLHIESNAALAILKKMGGMWKLFYVFKLVPRFIRDAVYKFIARNRKRWFGVAESCFIPEEKYKKRIL